MFYDIVLTKVIRSELIKIGLTEKELSDKVFIDISPYMSNKKNWPYYLVVMISDVLEISLDRLSGRLV